MIVQMEEAMPVKLEVGNITGGGNAPFSIPVEVFLTQAVRNAAPAAVAHTPVRIKRGVNQPQIHGTTDGNGEWATILTEPASSAGKSVTYTAVYGGETAPVTVTLPSAEGESDSPKDAVKAWIDATPRPAVDPKNVNHTVNVRVVGLNSVPWVGDFDLYWKGNHRECKTNNRGMFTVKLATNLIPDEKCDVKAVIPGIEKPAIKTLHNRKVWPKRFSKDWWKTNNAIALMLMAFVTLTWVFYFSFGFESKAVFGLGSTVAEIESEEIKSTPTLAQMEKYVNDSNGKYENVEQLFLNPEGMKSLKLSILKGEQYDANKDGSKKEASIVRRVLSYILQRLWIPGLLLSFFTFFYAPLSLREEIGEELEKMGDELRNRISSKAEDGFLERFAAWTGAIGTARRTRPVRTAQGEQPVAKVSFWDSLRADMASDFLFTIGPALYRAVIR